ncbi:MAG: hypothetical protein JWO13_338 [Acidobacteriales bacterium]|nr:hypothetical protein [Terriglobales bacterium]
MSKFRILGARALALVTVLALVSVTCFAGNSLWKYQSSHEIKWQKITFTGSLLLGGDEALICLDPETGKPVWKRDDLQKATAVQVEEISGTPYLLVTKNSGGTKLFALNILSGETLWQTDKLKGAIIGVTPIYEKDLVLILTSRSQSDANTKPDMIALKISSGEMAWESEFADKFELHQEDGAGKWAPHYNLSGHQPPIYEADSIYFTYAGLHKYDINTGKLIWAVPYDVTQGKLKRGNAQAVITNDVIITSAKGELRAIEKATGKVKWKSQDFGAAVAEFAVKGNTIYGRMGGTFYDFAKRDWELKKPLGVVAVNLASGGTVWKYDGASDAITNMHFLEGQNTILIADANNVIGLDTTNEGKIKEAFKIKVEFKRKATAGRSAMKVARFGLGGIQGGMKGLKDDKKSEDVPVAILQQPNGDLVIRGRQHVVAFNPKTHEIPWAAQYEAPGMSGWQKYSMLAIVALNYLQATSVSSQTQYGSSMNDAANNTRQSMLSSYSNIMNKRYTATRSAGKFMHMLTNVEEGGDKGPGIVGVNMQNGETAYSLVLKDREPNYEVDEVSGRLYNLKNKELQAFSIQ